MMMIIFVQVCDRLLEAIHSGGCGSGYPHSGVGNMGVWKYVGMDCGWGSGLGVCVGDIDQITPHPGSLDMALVSPPHGCHYPRGP